MRRGLEEWSLNDACHSHQHEAAPGWADWYVGRWENTEKDVLFKKQVWGPHGGASQGSRDSKSRWLESFTRDFFQANRSKGSGPACLSAPSLVSNISFKPLSPPKTSTTPPSSHQETSLPTAQKIEVFRPELPPLPAPEQGLQAVSPCAGGGGLLRGPHPLAEATSAPGQALCMPQPPASPPPASPFQLPSSSALTQAQVSSKMGKPPSEFPLSYLPKKLELAFLSQPNLPTHPSRPTSRSGVIIPTGLWSSQSTRSSAHSGLAHTPTKHPMMLSPRAQGLLGHLSQ